MAPVVARVEDPPPWAALPPAAAARPETNGTPPAEPATAVDPSPGAPAADPPAAPASTTWIPISTPVPAPERYTPTWVSGQASPPPPAPLPAVPVSRIEPPLPPPRPVEPAPVAALPVAAVPVAPAPAPVSTGTPAPTGALVLLPGEEVVMQLGALYLTNRRAILYAPTILRAAFLRDIDAIGTVTERSSGWMLLLGLLALAVAAFAAFTGLSQPGLEFKIGDLYSASPVLLAIPLALIGILALASYFFWVKRSLFLSVGGRPLIVVSISGWNGQKLTTVDAFVNAFSQAKHTEAGGP